MHERTKILEMYNDVPELIWINPDNYHISLLHQYAYTDGCLDLHMVLNCVIGQEMSGESVSMV